MTGAGRGIGRATAIAMSELGYELILWSRSPGPLQDTVTQCDAGRAIVVAQALDISNPSSVTKAHRKTLGDKNLDLLIINAGAGRWSSLDELSLADWRKTFDDCATSAFLALKSCLPNLLSSEAPQVVFIGSDADHMGFPNRLAYCAAKYGLRGLGEAARKDLRKVGVRMTHVSPSAVNTDFEGGGRRPRPNGLAAEELANVVTWLSGLPSHVEIRELRLSSIHSNYGPKPDEEIMQ